MRLAFRGQAGFTCLTGGTICRGSLYPQRDTVYPDVHKWQQLFLSGATAACNGQNLRQKKVVCSATGAEADAELQRLSILRKNHADEQYIARRLRELPRVIEELSERLQQFTTDMETAATHAGLLRIDEDPVAHDEAVPLLGRRLESLPSHVRERRRVTLGTYRGPSREPMTRRNQPRWS